MLSTPARKVYESVVVSRQQNYRLGTRSSPFWVPFKPQTTDVAEIIPQIRAQMERAGA
jgi:hypothetical protein